MKKLAKLILFFSLFFVILFVASILFRLLSSWIDTIRIVPLEALPGKDVAETVWNSLPIVIYLSILLSLSFSSRRGISIPLSIICIVILACVFTLGASLGLSRTGVLKAALNPVPSVQGGPGLVLSQSDNVMVLLKESSELRGSRVVSLPGRPLIYQEQPLGPYNSILKLPDLPFGDDSSWFIRSMEIDFNLSAAEIRGRLEESYFSFAVYVFSLILLLASLRFLLDLSNWPLADIFLGALVFRLILSAETFLNTREINVLIGSFLGAKVPSMLITPLVFGAAGVLIMLYTLLTRIASKVGPWSRSGDA